MEKIENHCVSCDLERMWCGDCPHHEVHINACDRCGKHAEYELDDEYLCPDCLDEALEEAITSEFSWQEVYKKMFDYNPLNLRRL